MIYQAIMLNELLTLREYWASTKVFNSFDLKVRLKSGHISL